MFTDVANVLHIREALYRHKALGNASIMVGAGFSRNASPMSSTARPMPNWAQMATALCKPLYPTNPEMHDNALREASATSGFLRMAQEYKSAFGASSLNHTVRNLVPDLDYHPGDLHKRLLRLPWADVFTTNWDTLLERTCADVFERSYDIVRTVEEVPFTMRPRIVKLHGTFPSHEPFIFTEDDYRTYPVRFAPFVNLVQQSMMETIFCLIGFSGDDPNFLSWSGWVRDNLGPSAPKIYLVGWLGLSVHRRRMLEERHVMPIDIANLPEASDWPEHLRHIRAAEWFISALEAGRPYNMLGWPSPPSGILTSGGVSLPPNPAIAQSPKQELRPEHGDDLSLKLARLKEAAKIWEHNRMVYPGWLIAPDYVREQLWMYIRSWLPDFPTLIPHLNGYEKLFTIGEWVWRSECALMPLFNDMMAVAMETVKTVDLQNMTISGSLIPEGKGKNDVAATCVLILKNIARTARHDGKEDVFHDAVALLSACAPVCSDAGNICIYEQILDDLGHGKNKSAQHRISAWDISADDPVWLSRKAGLLSELGDHGKACRLLEQSLVKLRKMRRRDTDDIPSLSRESWALYFALAFTHEYYEALPKLSEEIPRPRLRWRELAIVECDAWGDYQLIKRTLESNKERLPDVTIQRNFDLDHQSETHHFAQGPSEKWRAAFHMIHLAEQTGIPASANRMGLFREALITSAGILKDDEYWLTAQLTVRLLRSLSESELGKIYDRTYIAKLPSELVSIIENSCIERIDEALDQIQSSEKFDDQINVIRNGMELLSRASLRVEIERLHSLLQKAATYYKNTFIQGRIHQFKISIQNLFARIFEAMPPQEVEQNLAMIFALPLPSGEKRFWSFEPTHALSNEFKPTQTGRTEQWDGIISLLLSAADSEAEDTRKSATLRLHYLWSWGWLNEVETRRFSDVLWTKKYIGEDGLPTATDFLTDAFSSLPHPADINPANLLTSLIAKIAARTDMRPQNKLTEIGDIIGRFKHEALSVELSAETNASIVHTLTEWADSTYDPRRINFMGNSEDKDEIAAVQAVSRIISYIDFPVEINRSILKKIKYLDEQANHFARGYELYAELSALFPDEVDYFIGHIFRGLLSDEKRITRSAVQGLFLWLHKLTEENADNPNLVRLSDLVREIGVIIAARREAALRSAMEIAIWIFRKGSMQLKEIIAQNCLYGLSALLSEATYSKSTVTTLDIPSIRAACVRLAYAMKEAGYPNEAAVVSWVDVASDDPLPEVRNAAILYPGSQLD